MEKILKLNLAPEWDEIEKVRNKSSGFLESHGFSESHINALTMVVSELMENAVKYGSFTGKAGLIDLSIDINKNNVIIEVKCPVDAGEISHLRKLDETIQWIRGFQDPFEAYIVKLKEVATKSLQDKESGLGLVRISYEGQSILDFYVGDDNILSVSAVYNY
jgi:hypothetical protein